MKLLGRRLLEGESAPAGFDLVFRDLAPPAFFLTARDETLKEISLTNVPIPIMAETFGRDLQPYQNNSTLTLGFDNVFKPCPPLLPLDGFSSWRADLPTGVWGEPKKNWNQALQLACTLAVITHKFMTAEVPPNSDSLEQLATFNLIARHGPNGFSTEVTLAPAVRNWIGGNRQPCYKAARDAMLSVQKRLRGNTDFTDCFHASGGVDGKGLSLIVPGNACDLLDEDTMDNPKPGWHLESHNVDTPFQQLELVAGIAAILDLVRSDQLLALAERQM